MDDLAAEAARLLRQQTAIVRFGSFALSEFNLLKVLNEATRIFAERLRVGLGLTGFGGHPETFTRGASDAKIPTTVFA